jgi:hypothetical protein
MSPNRWGYNRAQQNSTKAAKVRENRGRGGLRGSFGVCLSCHCLVCSVCPHRKVVPEDGNGFEGLRRRILHLISVLSLDLPQGASIEREKKKRQKRWQVVGDRRNGDADLRDSEIANILIRRSTHRMSTISVKLTVHRPCHRGTPGTRLKRSPVEFLIVSLAKVRVHQYKSACNVVKKAVGFNYVVSWIGFCFI